MLNIYRMYNIYRIYNTYRIYNIYNEQDVTLGLRKGYLWESAFRSIKVNERSKEMKVMLDDPLDQNIILSEYDVYHLQPLQNDTFSFT